MGHNIKGTLLCKCSRIGDFETSKSAIEATDVFLRDYKFPIAPARTYDSFDVVRNSLKQMRGYKLPLRTLWEEDVIENYLDDNVCRHKTIKWRDIMGFYHEEGYWPRFDKCIENFDEIMAQVLEETRISVNPKSPKPNSVL